MTEHTPDLLPCPFCGGEAEIATLTAECERLNQSLRWEQHRDGRIGTHGPNCHLWGHQHYECLLRKFNALETPND